MQHDFNDNDDDLDDSFIFNHNDEAFDEMLENNIRGRIDEVDHEKPILLNKDGYIRKVNRNDYSKLNPKRLKVEDPLQTAWFFFAILQRKFQQLETESNFVEYFVFHFPFSNQSSENVEKQMSISSIFLIKELMDLTTFH